MQVLKLYYKLIENNLWKTNRCRVRLLAGMNYLFLHMHANHAQVRKENFKCR